MTLSNLQTQFSPVDFDPFAEGDVLLTALATESQKEIWASVQMGDDANCAYNESQTLRLQGILQVEILQAAFQELVRRHESLRMTISPDGNILCINENLALDIPLVDLSNSNEPDQKRQLGSLVHTEVKQPFDLEHGPLFRVKIVRLQPQEHHILMTAHHIICDGWSWGVLMPDLGKIYSATLRGEKPELEPCDRFSDYALLIEDNAESEEARVTEEFWLNQFSQSVPVLDFPTDFPRPPLRTFNSNRYDYSLLPNLVTDLKQLGIQIGCSFMTVLLASFEVFLYRLTAQTDVVIGISAAGQATSGNYNLVGHCVHLLPMRTQIDPKQAFSDYLTSRKFTVPDAYDHQEFTFGRLVQKLALPRDPSRIPLVPVTFNVDQGLKGDKLPFDGLEVEFFSNPRTYENFELYLNATELDGRLTLECQYNTNLFSRETIHRRLKEFETLLVGITTQPHQIVSSLPILPEIEYQQLAKWNITLADYPKSRCLHELFEDQVERTPNNIAVIFEEQQLTYQELNHRSNQLARYLHKIGVRPNIPVGICVERSLEMVIGVLGILKAGGTYVPLDPEYPNARLTYMLEDAQVSVLLTQHNLAQQIPNPKLQVVLLDQDWEIISQYESQNLEIGINTDVLAYIIYTSGSTGKPKGVMIPHRAICNHMHWMQATFPLDETDKVLQKTPFCFDASVWEFYAPLLAGAQLVVARPNGHKQADYLIDTLVNQKITVLQTVPALLQMLLEQPEVKNCSSLKRVFCGGESLTLGLQTRFFFTLNASLINLYGPTEACIDTTFWICQPSQKESTIPIGQPISNVQVYVLDTNLQHVPIGVPGELHISGEGLAKGYLNHPDLTAEKFVSHPFTTDSKARLYKTGDLARFLPNGQIECLGRVDYQVKIRGFRIELEEVEVALSEHPSVLECVVAAWKNTDSDERLVAYIVNQRGDEGATVGELRTFMKQKVPDFMVPSNFVLIETLPLTPNGKVDRKALPQPDVARSIAENYVAPRTEVEQEMATLWAQILKLERVGIYDNFFELGGHSLLAAQLLARIRQKFAIDLQLRMLFEASTVADLTERLETIRWAAQRLHVSSEDTATDYEEGEL